MLKAVLRGKLIPLSASKKKPERAYISTLKTSRTKEPNTPKRITRQEIIKLGVEISLRQKQDPFNKAHASQHLN